MVLCTGLLTACAKPALVQQDGRNYAVQERDEELFVYVDYHWKGLKFDDAVALEKAFATWGREQGIYVYALARFPGTRDWQLGFVATGLPQATAFEGRKIRSLKIPPGDYAAMRTIGNVDNMFRYWKKFVRWIEEDGRTTEGPVLEIYPDIFAGRPVDQTRGELRYRLAEKP